LEYIIYNQYIILDYYTDETIKYISELNNIIGQFQSIPERIL